MLARGFGKKIRRLALVGSVLATALAGLVATPAAAFPTSLQLPFDPNVAWYVCQGYNGNPSHSIPEPYGDPALDLTTYSGRGPNGCSGGENHATGKAIYAPAAGSLVNLNNGLGGICITFAGGGSMYWDI